MSLLLVVIITIVIVLRSCGDGDKRSITTTPGTSTTTTTQAAPTSSTLPAPEDPVPPRVRPVPPEVVEVLEEHCVPVPEDPEGGDDDPGTAYARLLDDDLESVKGPDASDVPPALGSGDPALEVLRAAGLLAGCEEVAYPVVIAELGGTPDHTQIEVALDIDPGGGFQPDPAAPDGIGRVGGWDLVGFLHPDGSSGIYDSGFQQVSVVLRAVAIGAYVVFHFEEVVQTGFDWVLQSFRRDGTTANDPVDWSYVSGSHQPER